MIVRNHLRRSLSRAPESDIHFQAVLPDDGRVALRPLARGETKPQTTVLERMSAASRWQRFLSPMPTRVPPALLTVLGEVDGHRHVAWLATVDGQPAGVARYIMTGKGVAEIAFEVVDAQQGRGIASMLLDAVCAVAATNGIRRLSAMVHPDHAASVRLLRRVGLRLLPIDGLLEGESDLRLPDPPRVDRATVIALHQAKFGGGLHDRAAIG